MLTTLKERIVSYQEITDYKLLAKLPVITIVNGRQFRKTTSLLKKPFDIKFFEILTATAVKLMQEIDGSMFSYSFNDEIVIVSRNDKNIDTQPYYDNKIQKIVSAVSSIATYELNRIAGIQGVELFGDPVFIGNCFAVPHIGEAVNVLVGKQQQCFHTALYQCCFYNLMKMYNVEIVRDTLSKKSVEGKMELLLEDFGINFDDLPLTVRRGVGVYREMSDGVDKPRKRLTIDVQLPVFAKEQAFLMDILNG